MQEICQSSKSPDQASSTTVSTLITLVWAISFIVLCMMGAVVYIPAVTGVRELHLLIWADQLRIGMYLLAAFSTLLLCKIVIDISKMQKLRAQNLRQPGIPLATAVPSPFE